MLSVKKVPLQPNLFTPILVISPVKIAKKRVEGGSKYTLVASSVARIFVRGGQTFSILLFYENVDCLNLLF